MKVPRAVCASYSRSLVETVVGGCGLVLVEHRSRQGLGEVPAAKITDERCYGSTVVDFYEPE